MTDTPAETGATEPQAGDTAAEETETSGDTDTATSGGEDDDVI